MKESPQEHLLFHAPLTDSLNASFSAGDGMALISPNGSDPSFEDDGIRAGANFARDTCVTYAVEENFNRQEGTVLLWFKPDWDAQEFQDDLGRIIWDVRIVHGSVVADDPSQRWALVFPNPTGKGRGHRSDSTFGCWRFCVEINRNRFVIGTREPRKDSRTRQAVFGTQQEFKAGQWIHLAVGWNSDTGVIWVNALEDRREKLEEGLPDRPLPERMQLGAIPSWINAGACGVIADFRVYGTLLGHEEVSEASGLETARTETGVGRSGGR